MKPAHEQLAIIKQRAVEIIPEDDLHQKLDRAVETDEPLRVKLGVDPTAPNIHVGIGVVLEKLRDFQDLGHTAVLIVGDFTARIGDPSGRDTTRPILTFNEIQRNMETYKEQAFGILDPDKTEIHYNSKWLEPMSFEDIMELTSKYTVARMLERDDFHKRYQEGQSITLLEFLYPLAQAYDSVAIDADVELGGTDQRFNLLVGREIQERYDQDAQVAMLMPLLEGTDGVKKMSKSHGNTVGITENADEIYGKLMSIPDDMLERYTTLLTDMDYQALKDEHPMQQKKRLAHAVVSKYHPKADADHAAEEFERVFGQGERPDDVPQVTLDADALEGNRRVWIVELMDRAGLVDSRSEARRLVQQGAVEYDGERITDADAHIELNPKGLLKVGKRRFAEIHVEGSA
ncbi:MAG: tyrosine--tRNA ligase [Candidatus Bipolaricaulia bacterium]